MAGVRKKKLTNGKYQGWFTAFVDGKKKRVYRTGTHNRKQTLEIVQRLEDEHRQIVLGYREPPKPFERHKDKLLSEITSEYIAWGKAQGGRNGYPWNKRHANRNVAMLQKFWVTELEIKSLGDMQAILSSVEKSIQGMLDSGKSGKTIKHDVGILNSFCNWCIKHDYLAENPLKKLKPVQSEATFKRRAVTYQELNKIIKVITANSERFGHWKFYCLLHVVLGFAGMQLSILRLTI